MTESIHVTLALPLADELHTQLRKLDSLLEFTALTPAQRRAYRGGRPLWGGYGDAPAAEGETPEDAAAAFQIARVHPTRIGVALMVRDLVIWLDEQLPDALSPKTVADAPIAQAAGVQ